jgi:transposase-like protein
LTTRLERDRLVWETSVVQCLVLGLSRRTIAAAAGVSHQTVTNIAQRQLGDAYPTAGHFET